jgi:hypothetical protein
MLVVQLQQWQIIYSVSFQPHHESNAGGRTDRQKRWSWQSLFAGQLNRQVSGFLPSAITVEHITLFTLQPRIRTVLHITTNMSPSTFADTWWWGHEAGHFAVWSQPWIPTILSDQFVRQYHRLLLSIVTIMVRKSTDDPWVDTNNNLGSSHGSYM